MQVDGSSTEAMRSLLCLEDDPLVQRALQRSLPELHLHIVDTVAQGKAALASERFDAWFLDVRVPDGSGLDLLEWARARGDTTPALVMTGSADRTPANAAQELGAEFVYKPFSVANLRAFLARCGSARAPVEARAPKYNVDAFVRRYRLTPRQAQIVTAMAAGVERPGLAAALGVTENTIKTLVRRMLDRTGHRDLAHLYRELAGPIG